MVLMFIWSVITVYKKGCFTVKKERNSLLSDEYRECDEFPEDR